MKTLFITAALLVPTALHAAVISETFGMSTSSVIPDGDLNGLVQVINPSTIIGTVDFLSVTLTTTGGWNGDLYAYLWHNGEISVLLNRTGRTSGNNAGTATSGMTLVFEDTATADIHGASGGFGSSLTGTFQPSGRAIHPLNALDTTPRTLPLSVFSGDAAAGEYRLFIADVASGETATLASWSITLTGEAIPEPSVTLLGSLAGLSLLLRRKR